MKELAFNWVGFHWKKLGVGMGLGKRNQEQKYGSEKAQVMSKEQQPNASVMKVPDTGFFLLPGKPQENKAEP